MSAEDAATLIPSGVNVGMSGFTGSGYPKVVPKALARHIMDENLKGRKFKIGVWTGSSTAPELDGALSMVDGIELRLPYQSDATCRRRINTGDMQYVDIHLGHVAHFVQSGFLGKLDIAVIEVVGILEDGRLIPSTSVGNNRIWIDQAEKVILEVNSWHSAHLEGMHDIYYGHRPPPNCSPIPILKPDDRIGVPYLSCPQEKILAIVETHGSEESNVFSPSNEDSRLIAGHIVDFLTQEVKKGRIPQHLLPLQSGVGNIANAVLEELNESSFTNVTAYTEVIQDGMLKMMRSGKMIYASATAFALSIEALNELYADIDFYRQRIILRPQEISNYAEVIRRLGCLTMNGLIEADIYGNVNSTHVMGTRIQNGIGGSGDFTRNAFISFFMTPSQAKDGALSCIVPMVSHVDHTEHDVHVIVTEQGLADLRGLTPKQRAQTIIENCVHPNFKPAMREYCHRALEQSPGKHTPHLLDEVFSWHLRSMRTGRM